MKNKNLSKYQDWAQRIYAAVEMTYGHKSESPEHYLALAMSEVGEAIDADRKGKRAKTEMLSEILQIQAEKEEGITERWKDTVFCEAYDKYVKGSVEEEFADICLRILDLAYFCFKEKTCWFESYVHVPASCDTFSKSAWYFVKTVLRCGYIGMSESIEYMYGWAEKEDIDLDFHIEQKLLYDTILARKNTVTGKKY